MKMSFKSAEKSVSEKMRIVVLRSTIQKLDAREQNQYVRVG